MVFWELKKSTQNNYHPYPLRRRKGASLSMKKEIDYNKVHSAKRIVVVEHAICRLKKYRIMNDVFRNRLRKYIAYRM